MSFNEETARKMIMFLLEDDLYDFKRWVPLIKKFNTKQIQKLFKGERDYKYPVKNKDVFDKLLLKFDNFETILSKWYEKEEYYQYIKQLWLSYIYIEDINELIKKNPNEEKLTSFLESKNINYSKWPKEVKKEFKEAIQETIYIENDEKDLIYLINKIKANIKIIERKKKQSIFSLVFSVALGVGSILGSFFTNGGVSFFYSISTMFNLISGGLNTKDILDYSLIINELENKIIKLKNKKDVEEKLKNLI